MNHERRNTILALALPIIGGMTSQNILNLIDTAMVGHLGEPALAAVGLGGFANFMCIALITGLGAGVQAIAARRKGEGQDDRWAFGLNAGLLLALCVGLPLSLLLIWQADAIYPWLIDDPAVIAEGIPYFEARLAGMVAVGMNFAFRGYWNGISMSKLYLRTLLLMHSVNLFLNYALIFGNFGFPELGTLGAGLGTTISLYIGAAYYFYQGWSRARPNGFLHGMPKREAIAGMLRISLPSSIQQFFFAAGLTAMFWIIGQIGTVSLAAANVIVNIMLVAILPGIGLGLAAASLAGQALGRGDTADAKNWGWDVVKIQVVILSLLGLPMILVPDLLLSVFLHDPDTRELAKLPLQIVGFGIAIDGIGLVLMNALLGVGASKQVMWVSLAGQWLVFLPVAWLVGPYLGGGLLAVWIAQFVYRGAQAGVFAWLWHRAEWATIKV